MKKRSGERKQNLAGLRPVDAEFSPNGDAYEEPEPEEAVWEEEEEEPLSPWVTVLIFVGLAVLAAIICVILWHFSHKDKDQEGSQDMEPGIESLEGEELSSEGEDPEESAGDSEAPGDAEEGGQEEGDREIEESADEEIEGSSQESMESDSVQGSEQEPAQGTAAMTFTGAEDSVTPKDVVNLRSVPTTADESNIVVQVQNGELLTRSGVNQDTGWSRIEYGGETLYAVSQYLTTDLDYKPPVQQANPNRVSTVSGRIILFSDCDDWISPKEYVNLRTEPSTTEGDSTVSCQLNYGEKAHRTGYSTDSGWSRVEYNGQVLYVVTSLMYEVEGD